MFLPMRLRIPSCLEAFLQMLDTCKSNFSLNFSKSSVQPENKLKQKQTDKSKHFTVTLEKYKTAFEGIYDLMYINRWPRYFFLYISSNFPFHSQKSIELIMVYSCGECDSLVGRD